MTNSRHDLVHERMKAGFFVLGWKHSGKSDFEESLAGWTEIKMDRSNEVLNAKEAAVFLNAYVETLRRMDQLGEIAAFKVGKH